MRYFFITQDRNLPGSIRYRDFDINGSRHVFSKADSGQLDSVVALYHGGGWQGSQMGFPTASCDNVLPTFQGYFGCI